MNILLPIAWNGLASGYCFVSWDQLGLDFANAMQAQLANGRSFYNIGDTKPDPQYQAYPWLRTTDGRWYVFAGGKWRSPMNRDTNERRLFVGSLTDLQTYDGGDTGTPGPMSGPSWQEDTDFSGRSPMGPGAIASSDPAKTLTIGESYGAGSHELTEAEGAVGSHRHAMGIFNPSGDDIFLSKSGLNTVSSYNSKYVTGSDGIIEATQTTADAFTLPANNGAGVTSAAFSVVHPVRGCYVIKPSGRQYYVVN